MSGSVASVPLSTLLDAVGEPVRLEMAVLPPPSEVSCHKGSYRGVLRTSQDQSGPVRTSQDQSHLMWVSLEGSGESE